MRQRRTQQPPSVWTLVYDGFDPARQGLREALCALGNGYFVTRGALPEAEADDVNYPGTYVAGLYNRAETEIAGRTVENEDLVNVPNWLPLRFRIAGGQWFDVRRCRGRASTASSWTCAAGAHPAADLAGRRRPADERDPAPVRQHEGRAPRRPADHLHGGELVGPAGGVAPGWTAGWSTQGSSATGT